MLLTRTISQEGLYSIPLPNLELIFPYPWPHTPIPFAPQCLRAPLPYMNAKVRIFSRYKTLHKLLKNLLRYSVQGQLTLKGSLNRMLPRFQEPNLG